MSKISGESTRCMSLRKGDRSDSLRGSRSKLALRKNYWEIISEDTGLGCELSARRTDNMFARFFLVAIDLHATEFARLVHYFEWQVFADRSSQECSSGSCPSRFSCKSPPSECCTSTAPGPAMTTSNLVGRWAGSPAPSP